ncbi:CgeB family protein [Roseisolibacter agri]|uniref:Glycosyl transferase n=1 Tax=Roseisolibacter agri TaxID=2014610 RepID=A0AA37VDW8_9BACT|nr:glycosyltransferase [Roseisolibacter agri]GLC24299.1 glycosyl transferase [Roseisolibacter agri]
MRIVVFGLSVSSSWGNGHATLWRALLHALARAGHRADFFERDVPYYAAHRDLRALPRGELVLYNDWESIRPAARAALARADVAIVTSYCADATAACALVLETPHVVRAFYDLDTPVTLARLDDGEAVAYLPAHGLGDFDLVLSYTGGRALAALRARLGARRVVPLYGSVDPDAHRPAPPRDDWRCDLSYIGTYAADRQTDVDALLLQPARASPQRRFVLAGSQYPPDFPWTPNLWYLQHLPPADHPAFYASSRLTLNVTRRAMASMGWCPSGRLFEAAACGVPILTDAWDGLEAFYTPGTEILVATGADDALRALERDDGELTAIARRARERTLDEHTADHRAAELIAALEAAASPSVLGTNAGS